MKTQRLVSGVTSARLSSALYLTRLSLNVLSGYNQPGSNSDSGKCSSSYQGMRGRQSLALELLS